MSLLVISENYDKANAKLAISLEWSDVDGEFVNQQDKEKRSMRQKKPPSHEFTDGTDSSEDVEKSVTSLIKSSDFPTPPLSEKNGKLIGYVLSVKMSIPHSILKNVWGCSNNVLVDRCTI